MNNTFFSLSQRVLSDGSWRKQLNIRSIFRQFDRAFKFQAELYQYFDRFIVPGGSNSHNTVQAQGISAISHHSGRRLKCITALPELRQESKTNIHILQ